MVNLKLQSSLGQALTFFCIAILFTCCSVSITGFTFGYNNNFYHIPYVLDWHLLPEFKDDAFILTLQNFTSVVWPIIRLIVNDSNVELVFKCAHFLGRFIAIVGLIILLKKAGLTNLRPLILALSAIVLTPLMYGVSELGWHGMFIGAFFQTEVTWGFIFLFFASLANRNLMLSSLLAGIVFCINAFVGIWVVFIAFISLFFHKQELTLLKSIQLLLVFLLVSSPVLYWIWSSVSKETSYIPFSYVDFLRFYFPNHFLIESASAVSIFNLSALFCCGLIAATYTNQPRFWIGIQCGWLLLFLFGMVCPYITGSHFLINLHLLRSDGIEQAVATILISVASISLIESKDNSSKLLGFISLVSILYLVNGYRSLALIITFIALIASKLDYLEHVFKHTIQAKLKVNQQQLNIKKICSVLLAIPIITLSALSILHHLNTLNITFKLLIIFGIFLYFVVNTNNHFNQFILNSFLALFLLVSLVNSKEEVASSVKSGFHYEQTQDARKLERWIKYSDLHGVFLLPFGKWETNDFQTLARRQIWVGMLQGAAVIWSPSFYWHWYPRAKEVLALKTKQEYVEYAQKNHIHNILFEMTNKSDSCPAPSQEAKRSDYFMICVI